MPETVTITDNRTGRSVEVPIVDGGVDAKAWSDVLPGVWFLDPGYMTTASAQSAITELDGENGILRYRGYPIEQLAEHSTFLEVCYLLLNGELPTKDQLETWVHDVTYHTFLHEN
ncbi:MAG: citrate (Si)-synthase, partial [Acidimicrobiia bacterium]|nr:citrate (Si)-synthase [Acidimicrobiia bacterium]